METKAKPKRTIIRLWKYLGKHKASLAGLALLMLLSNVLALFIPSLSGRAVDAIGLVKGGVDFASVFKNCLMMLGCYALSSIMSYILSVSLIKISRSVACELRQDVFARLTALPVKFFDTHQSGDIISRICYDIDTLNASLSTDLLQMCTSAVTVTGSLIMLLSISPLLSLVFAVTVPASVLFSRHRMKVVRPLYSRRSEKLGRLNGFVEESVGGQRTVRAYGREAAMTEKFDESNSAASHAYYNADYAGCVQGPTVNLINNVSLSFISVFGAMLYLAGAMSLGNVSSFILYSRKFSGPIREAAETVGELQAAAAAAERVFRILDEPTETPDRECARPTGDVEGEVGFEDVCFAYDEGRPVLSDVSLDVPKGSIIAIVGPTGAGKTTIVNLLMRFYDPNRGRITVDDTDALDLTRESLRLSYSMVLQDTWLFRGTVYDNIAYGDPAATRERVEAAAKAARIHKFIMSLPNGYDTVLTDDAANISKGQNQLITIARAMLLDTRMLILDEATSNVDTSTEREITRAMRLLMRDKTCFVIAHRLSTIEHADLILVVDKGRIVERGTHAELLRKNGAYTALYRSQFEIG